jgi:hypothetical protein
MKEKGREVRDMAFIFRQRVLRRVLRRDGSLPHCKVVSICSAITGRGRQDEWRRRSVGHAADSGPCITGRVEMLVDLVCDGAKKKREAT